MEFMRGGKSFLRKFWELGKNIQNFPKFCVKFADVSFRTCQYFEENSVENIIRKKNITT